MIQIKQLSKKYKTGNIGLHPFDFEIEKGSIVALTGGNGAGKSTFIKLLTNIIRPTTGSIQWGAQRFSYMPDDMEFPTNLTGLEAIKLLGALRNVEEEKCSRLLEQVGLYDVRNQKIETFSKGMKQRLCFAQALLSNEKVLILDEPTNGLDPYWIKWMKSFLLEEKRKGKTIIFSTHNFSFVDDIADELLFFYEGHLLIQNKVNTLKLHSSSIENTIVSKLEQLMQDKQKLN